MRALALLAGALAASSFAASCSPKEGTPAPGPAAWRTVLDAELDRPLLSVWGAGSSDVFAVGGALGNGGEALALHFDGATWTDLHAGGTETFWWVHGTSSGDVWMVGTGGRISHWDGKTFTHYASSTTATIWGVFAFSRTDVWAVGGTPGDPKAPNDLVLHFDGTAFRPEALPGAPLGRSLFKVWGSSANDLYVVGEAGTVWHRQGTTWTLESKDAPLAGGTLFTVNGCGPSDVWAVGGGDVLHRDAAGWTKVPVELSSQVNGVACASNGEVAIVGNGGLKQRLTAGKWVDEFALPPFTDFHGVWADPAGGAYWAVGGDFLSAASPGKKRRGVLARYGAGDVSHAYKF